MISVTVNHFGNLKQRTIPTALIKQNYVTKLILFTVQTARTSFGNHFLQSGGTLFLHYLQSFTWIWSAALSQNVVRLSQTWHLSFYHQSVGLHLYLRKVLGFPLIAKPDSNSKTVKVYSNEVAQSAFPQIPAQKKHSLWHAISSENRI